MEPSESFEKTTPGRLQDSVVIVFGGTAGIGYGIVKALLREGAKVVMTGRNKERGEKAEKELPGSVFIQSDITNYQACEYVAKKTHDRFGKINIAVCNAGIYPRKAIKDWTEEHISEVLDVNLKGTMFATKACLPYLKESAKPSRGSRVILTSSITGSYVGCRLFGVYGASKAGQLGFMRTAAVELAPDNITVNAVTPGYIEPCTAPDPYPTDVKKAICAEIPVNRFGTAEEVANAVLFLASSESSYITGQDIAIDGGVILPQPQ